MQKIKPYLWFDDQAEEAARFYVSLFKDARILDITPNGETGPGAKGTPLLIEFQIEGQEFIALNGGPHFKFSEAISLFVTCESQEEVDTLWEKLSEGGETQQCGWLKDRYGLSWQIIPRTLMELMSDPDPEKAGRVTRAMLKMTKIDIAALKQAYQQAG